MYAFPDRSGNRIELAFEGSEGEFPTETPTDVLVIPQIGKGLVFTRHRTRGIELPGGKILPGEPPLLAAAREAYEEAGISFRALRRIGGYRIRSPEGALLHVKLLFWGEVEALLPFPATSDGLEALVFPEPPSPPLPVPPFSPYLGDDLYGHILAYGRKNGWLLP
ncbi:MAG: 8-oxo-dGTPase Bsu YtkD / 8-oxo-GTPase Bsu YtkD [Brockia lithotrophica]|uniref:8-oxo-dGTPase Bsu YtkD / 8-oxo-GTPase Bsu YtkD n=1 Tax=Brockia lithotrophica TaxID=933949 RepID=A0A2T5G7P8_9BACL|nr:NUDIX domain-containing protein [Brockia lithotrophica]MBT9253241.1 NUDIX domain-containing protein [Brockia lithotrophica]PTQ52189.1 MAG: 8-oxo-dGTPase Bsu YtkD / 8-oxo-GTPase Bsu YtkD [Brockia lithotrophica]